MFGWNMGVSSLCDPHAGSLRAAPVKGWSVGVYRRDEAMAISESRESTQQRRRGNIRWRTYRGVDTAMNGVYAGISKYVADDGHREVAMIAVYAPSRVVDGSACRRVQSSIYRSSIGLRGVLVAAEIHVC